jgi:hypothetical protein
MERPDTSSFTKTHIYTAVYDVQSRRAVLNHLQIWAKAGVCLCRPFVRCCCTVVYEKLDQIRNSPLILAYWPLNVFPNPAGIIFWDIAYLDIDRGLCNFCLICSVVLVETRAPIIPGTTFPKSLSPTFVPGYLNRNEHGPSNLDTREIVPKFEVAFLSANLQNCKFRCKIALVEERTCLCTFHIWASRTYRVETGDETAIRYLVYFVCIAAKPLPSLGCRTVLIKNCNPSAPKIRMCQAKCITVMSRTGMLVAVQWQCTVG